MDGGVKSDFEEGADLLSRSKRQTFRTVSGTAPRNEIGGKYLEDQAHHEPGGAALI